MDDIAADLLANTGALGVWVLGKTVVVDNDHHNEVLGGAVSDPSIKPPMTVHVEGETYFEFVERQIFAQRVGYAIVVVVFDLRSSHGLIRLRVRQAKEAIERAITARRG